MRLRKLFLVLPLLFVVLVSCDDEKSSRILNALFTEPVVDTTSSGMLRTNNFDSLYQIPDTLRSSELDNYISLYTSSDIAVRDSLRKVVQTDLLSDRLLSFAHHASVEGVRLQNKQLLHSGIVALSVNNANYGYSGSIRAMALLWYSYSKIEADPLPDFEEVMALSSDEFKVIMQDFIDRDPSLKDIRTFGYIDINQPNFDFVYYGFTIVSDSTQTDSVSQSFLGE